MRPNSVNQAPQRPYPPTAPHLPHVQPQRRSRPPRGCRRGCGTRLLVVFIVLFIVPMFLCGLAFLAYVLFPPPPIDLLVVGVDARPGEGMATRTDSILLVGVNPQRMRVSILSIPRDLFIDVPVYGMERINTVNALGEQEQAGYGVTLLSEAIAQNFGVHTDRYVRMDFNGFVAVIDAVGGVDVDVPYVIEDFEYPTEDFGTIQIRFEAGLQHMDGERALIYARTRHGDDDYQRAARQQQVLSALTSKLIIPAYWPGVAAAISQSVETNLSLIDMLLIAPPVLLSGGNFDQLVIDRGHIVTTGDGVAVPNYDLVNPWLAERFD